VSYTNYQTKLLLLSALGQRGQVDSPRELDNIKCSLNNSFNAKAFISYTVHEATYASVLNLMNDNLFLPNIIFYTGHSDSDGLIVSSSSNPRMEDQIDKFQLDDIVNKSPGLQLLFLNSCYSSSLGEYVHVKHPNISVISIAGAADINLSIEFSEMFFESLFSGKSYEQAYKYACSLRSKPDSKREYNPIYLSSNILGLHPLLTGRVMPDFLQRALPESDEIIASRIRKDVENYEFAQFATQVLPSLMFEEHPRPILIVGEGGSGKTSILAKFYDEICNKSAVFFYRVADFNYKYTASNINPEASERIGLFQRNLDHECRCNDISNAIVMIDGYNELPLEEIRDDKGTHYVSRADFLYDDIQRLKKKCGNRIILTSREVPPGFNRNFDIYRIQPLSSSFVHSYLAPLSTRINEIGYTEAQKLRLADELRTPLLLKAFLSDLWGKSHIDDRIKDKFSCLYRNKALSPTDVLWNYLCIEMLKTREDHEEDKAIDRAETAFLLLRFVAPYIANQVFNNNSPSFDELYHSNFSLDDIKSFVNDCRNEYRNVDISPFNDLDQIVAHEDFLSEMITVERILPLLESRYNLMINESGRYEFAHQSLAELLSGIHEQNSIIYDNYLRGY
jgi:hypothetical protein